MEQPSDSYRTIAAPAESHSRVIILITDGEPELLTDPDSAAE